MYKDADSGIFQKRKLSMELYWFYLEMYLFLCICSYKMYKNKHIIKRDFEDIWI